MNRWPPPLHVSGYRVAEVEGTSVTGKPTIGLVYTLVDEDGKEFGRTDVVKSWPDEAENYAKMHRLRLLMEALCQYYNSGGDSLDEVGVSFIDEMPKLELPEGWELFSTSPGEHFLYTPNKEGKQTYLRVVDNEFTEELSDEDFLELKTGFRSLKEIGLE